MTSATPETPELVRLSVKTAPDQARRMEELARKHQRTLSGEVRMAMAAWIERCEAEASGSE